MNTSLSAAIKEAKASAPSQKELHTIQISHPAVNSKIGNLDVCFLLDTQAEKTVVSNIDICCILEEAGDASTFLTDYLDVYLDPNFSGTVRYSLIGISHDDGSHSFLTSTTFTNRTAFLAALTAMPGSALTPIPSAGVDAMNSAATVLDWTAGAGTAKVIYISSGFLENNTGVNSVTMMANVNSKNILVVTDCNDSTTPYHTYTSLINGQSTNNNITTSSVLWASFGYYIPTTALDTIKAQILATAASLATAFPQSCRFAFGTFDTLNEFLNSGQQFLTDQTDLATFVNAAPPTLHISANQTKGYQSIYDATNNLFWRLSTSQVARLIIIFTNQTASTADYSESTVAIGLVNYDICLSGYNPLDTSYADLLTATGGFTLTPGVGYLNALLAFLQVNATTPVSNVYLVRDRVPWSLTLEDSTVQAFVPCAFRFQLPNSDDQGLQELALGVDNTDRQIGVFLESIKGYNQPVVVTYRIYLASDPTTLQNNPPLVLFLRQVQSTVQEITGNCSYQDIINQIAPNELYTTVNFPTLK